MKKERVKKGEIIIGKPIPWNAFDENGMLLLRKGQIIQSASQLDILIARGLFHVKLENEDDTKKLVIKAQQSPFELIDSVQIRLENLFKSITSGASKNFSVKILELCKMLQQACELDTDAALGTIFMDNKCGYTIIHPIHIAILCEVMSRELKWSENDRLLLLAAALTQNVAINDLQDKLYHQKEPLSNEQKQLIHEHPERSVELLSSAEVTNRVWLDAVLYHHEALDGSGYPFGLKGYAIPKSARLITVGDIYGASISKRTYREALPPDAAMREIYIKGGERIETDLIKMCVKLIGIYPPGTFVRLMNGEIAVVTHRGEKAHLPIAHSVVRENGKMFLDPQKRDCSKDQYSIKEIITNDKDKIPVNCCQLWKHGNLMATK
jgi:HD-GYP domain-containing protein (c-di-GMP phosphodiesterase class II)